MTTETTTFLTPNRRLAVYHAKQYQLTQMTQGISCWKSMDILPFTSWIERTWNEYSHQVITENFLLLTANQELTLWENIINQSPESDMLLQTAETADLAKSAWGLLKQWKLNLNDSQLKATEDSFTFLKWAIQFQKNNKKNKWLDQNSLCDLLTEKIKSGLIKLEKKIVLISFTEISPQQQTLLSACEAQGTLIEYFHQEKLSTHISRISLADSEEELITMARWAKNLLKNSPPDKPPSIACIIPNLEDIRDNVNRIFTEILTESQYYTTHSLTLPFNISAGKSLASYPIIHTALQLLKLHTDEIAIDAFSNILLSPFIGDAEKEMLKRANFDNQLRRDNNISIKLTKILQNKYKPELFTARVKEYLTRKNKILTRHSASEWVIIFMDLLVAFGWPGERSVNSEEYQVIQRWIELLDEYRRFDTILEENNFQVALHQLIRLTANTVFQPQSPQTPIQILGILEAAEMPFDYLWVMGMDDTRWPPPPKPNPFIPQHLQRSLKMPHATAERELQFCKNIIQQLKNSTHEIYFSYALFDNESENRVSSLIEDIQEVTIEQLHLPNYVKKTQQIFQAKHIETLIDDKANPVDLTEAVRGGAKIFELQAACPFKAFSELRLFAKAIEETSLGLRAFDRGKIIHKALEIIWYDLKDSNTLHGKTNDELELIISSAIEKAILEIAKEDIHRPHYIKLESQRLQKIIKDWLETEKLRPYFKISALEQRYEVKFANIPITLQIDRIDEFETDEKLIIDYKTGKTNQIQNWFSERPEAPQLPLYCLINPINTVGITYASIHAENIKFIGISKNDFNINGIVPFSEVKYTTSHSWNEQLQHWHVTLETLGYNFCQGAAEVDPKNSAETCKHCKLQSFCRIYENYHD
jgi:ATP-dependent helicase/nuclease subunit B